MDLKRRSSALSPVGAWGRVRATALVTSLVLVTSLAQAVVFAQEARAEPKIPRRDLPLLASSAKAKPVEPESPAKEPKADFTALARSTAEASAAAAEAPQTSLVSPADDSVVATQVPILKVQSAGSGVLYCFKVSTGFDGASGSVVDSGCLSTPQWKVPKHVLRDGGRYTWTAGTTTGAGQPVTPPSWVAHFTVDMRMGDPGPAPVDELGPVAVNLFNGNAQTKASGPEFQAVGGPAGVTFAYNSRQGEPRGVRASYFDDANHDGVPDGAPVMIRSEAQVNLDWGNVWSNVSENLPWKENPLPSALDETGYVIRWEGYFRAPASGDFRFAGMHADGARIWVDGRLVYDNPNAVPSLGNDFLQAGPKQDADVPLTTGQRAAVKVELYHHSAERPRMVLWTKSTTGTTQRSHNLSPRVVTTEMLYAQDPQPLPSGWTLGVAGSGYTGAEALDGSVVLTDTSGGKHTWTKTSSGGYAPPAGEDGVLSFDADGRITITETDVASIFNPDGTLAQVVSVLDSKKPASLQYLYSGAVPRLTQIKDPVSGRSHTLYYNTDGTDGCYGGTARPAGSHPAPAQKLCRIRYWDGTETRLWYSMDTLARIENPGAAITDYNYLDRDSLKVTHDRSDTTPEQRQQLKDQVGPLTQIRTPQAYDWLARQTPAGRVLAERTEIEYESIYESDIQESPLRAVKVLAPFPSGYAQVGARPGRTYTYDLTRRETAIWISGLNTVRSRVVTYDSGGRESKTTDADGVASSLEWNSKDNLVASVDAPGKRTTHVYDHADRLTDSYGPAAASCFDGQTPTSACADKVPHQRLGYDEGIRGLQAALYDNPYLSGAPAVWQTGVGTGDGSLSGDWGAGPPVAGTGGWSGRFTGEIRFPETGEYKVGFTVVDGVRLWIDDVLRVDSWTDKASTEVSGKFTNTKAGSRHRIRVEYYNRSGNTGALALTWTPPGDDDAVTVPGEHLAPRYGYETSKITYSSSAGDTERAPSTKTTTDYSDPAAGIDPVFGLLVSKTSDPGGLDLVRRNLFESPGNGFLRRLAEALPGGDIADPAKRGSATFYGDNETRADPCEEDSPAVNQGGMVKTQTAAKNADGSANKAEQVYNAAGLVVATRINDEPWSCTGHDARGRVVRKSFPAQGGQPARTITYDHAVGGDPLTTRTTDESGSTTAVVDLLGQVVSYTDANGAVTTTKYDAAGRKTSETTTVKGVTSTLAYRWTDGFRLTRTDLDGTTVATPAYSSGRLQTVRYGNTTDLTLTYNDAGPVTGLKWKTPASTVTDTAVRSRDQRITDTAVTDTSTGTTYDHSYTYDGVGRLVAATVPHHRLTYGFAGDGGCGPNPKAGANTNRTTFTDSLDGAAPATTTYCYDHADRLISTSGATALSFDYDVYGNATKVGTDTLGYDSTRRHVSTTTAAGRSISYTRDINDRIIARTFQEGTQAAQTTRYAFTSDSGGPDFVLDAAGNLRQRVLKLPGGVVLTKNYTPNTPANWAYPDIQGHILFTANGSGVRTGKIRLYDPFGQNIDPDTGAIGDIPLPATAEGGMDFGYLGQHTVPIEHLASHQALEMGARTYLPVLGRFLQTDPVSGGSANNYDYANGDPINNRDLTGKATLALWAGVVGAIIVLEVLDQAREVDPSIPVHDPEPDAPMPTQTYPDLPPDTATPPKAEPANPGPASTPSPKTSEPQNPQTPTPPPSPTPTPSPAPLTGDQSSSPRPTTKAEEPSIPDEQPREETPN